MATNKIRPFNRLEILSSDLDFFQDVKDQDTRSRLLDVMSQPGILTPTGSTVTAIQNQLPTVLPIFDATAGNIHVGTSTITPLSGVYPNPTIHIAYDALGNRIELPAGDDTPFNTNAPAFTTTGITGSTPYSTGRLTVSGRTPSSGTEDRYVFISHVPVVRTKSTFDPTPAAPNHQTSVGSVVTAANNRNKPVTGIDQKLGQAHADHIINGYRIFVAIGAGSTLGPTEVSFDPDGTPRLIAGLFTASEPDSINAIYIGRFTITSLNVIAIFALPDSIRPRDLMQFRPLESTQLDTGNPTTIYAAGQIVSGQQHINAFGTGSTLDANNPHRQSIFDLDDVSAITGQAVQPIGDVLTTGIIDKAQDRNAIIPTSSTAVQPSLVTTGSATYTSATSLAIVTGGILTTTTIAAGTVISKRAELVADLISLPIQAIYIDGTRITKLRPFIPGSLVTAAIPFVGTGQPTLIDATGTYTLFIANPDAATRTLLGLAVDEGLIGKTTEDISAVRNTIAVATVYWDSATEVLRYTNLTAVITTGTPPTADLRRFGLVSTPQISTEALSSASKGLMANQHFDNLTSANSDFRFGFANWVYADADTSPVFGAGNISAVAFLKAAGGLPDPLGLTNPTGIPAPTIITDAELLTQANAYYGVKYTFAPTPPALSVAIRTSVGGIKPNTTYTFSMQIKTPATNQVNATVALTNATGGSPYSNRQDMRFTRDDDYHRVAVTLRTNGTPDITTSTVYLEIKFGNDGSFGVFTANPISISSIIMTEGEFVLGNLVRTPVTYSIGSASIISTSFTAGTADSLPLSFVSTGQHMLLRAAASIDIEDLSAFTSVITQYFLQLVLDGGVLAAQNFTTRYMLKVTGVNAQVEVPMLLASTFYVPAGTHSMVLRAIRIAQNTGVFVASNIRLDATTL